MNQQVSIVYVTEKIPIPQMSMLTGMQEVIGEKYCTNNKLIVLENTEAEIKILLAKENLLCIDELVKVLPREKRINAMLVEKEEIQRLFTKIYDLFGANHCH
ncbi:MAG: hypothetical protein ABFD63_09865 [Smithella sp.]